jgi:hypothetical protein
MRIVSWLAVGAVALALGCASNSASTQPSTASTPPSAATAHPAMAGAPPAKANGAIQNYTQDPAGQMNGFVLATGQRVQVPTDMGAKVSDQFPPNTAVDVTGHMVTDSDGRSVLVADSITDRTRNATLDLTAGRAAPPSPAWGPSVGGSGPAGTQPVNPPAETQPGTTGNPPPGGR